MITNTATVQPSNSSNQRTTATTNKSTCSNQRTTATTGSDRRTVRNTHDHQTWPLHEPSEDSDHWRSDCTNRRKTAIISAKISLFRRNAEITCTNARNKQIKVPKLHKPA
jgi:hypothetical protein